MGCLRVGAAGWQTIRAIDTHQSVEGPALAVYSEHFNCVEVSSTFFRVPSITTFTNWGALTPSDFRFSLRVPEAVSHSQVDLFERRSRLRAFLWRLEPLAVKVGAIVATLSVEAKFDRTTMAFLSMMREQCEYRLVCQTRHPTWLSTEADRFLRELGIFLVATTAGGSEGMRSLVGDPSFVYWRAHHAPGQNGASTTGLGKDLMASGADIWIICDHCRHAYQVADAVGLDPAFPAARGRLPEPAPAIASDLDPTQLFHLYFLKRDHTISHILAREFTSCEHVVDWIGQHRYSHDIEVWLESKLIALCPSSLCPGQAKSSALQ